MEHRYAYCRYDASHLIPGDSRTLKEAFYTVWVHAILVQIPLLSPTLGGGLDMKVPESLEESSLWNLIVFNTMATPPWSAGELFRSRVADRYLAPKKKTYQRAKSFATNPGNMIVGVR